MPLRCPVCKADNPAGPNCRRCKADLRMLFALERRRAELLARSRRAFDAGSPDEALQLAADADDLRRGEDTRRWRAALNLLAGQFGEAWRLYRATPTDA